MQQDEVSDFNSCVCCLLRTTALSFVQPDVDVCTAETCSFWLKVHVISDCHVAGMSSNKCNYREIQLTDGYILLKGVNELRHVISTCIVLFG
jgi:hypothetical protein